ncbi:GNAT family N-acetyltransferase [Serratia marcescens]|uniref:GNAT family N-acetyltransferase n=1 Tax=Serratia marcescens TaxID=615 RepID=UPI003D1836C4
MVVIVKYGYILYPERMFNRTKVFGWGSNDYIGNYHIMREIISKLVGWQECSLADYSSAFHMYGGNCCTNPVLLRFLQRNTPEKYRFYSKSEADKIKAAIFINTSGDFCLPGKYNNIVSADEIVFPIERTTKVILPYKSKKISSLIRYNCLNCLPSYLNKRRICLIKEDFSVKSKRNRRNELNKFIKNGGEVIPASHYSPQEICNIYNNLFKKRWGVGLDSKCIDNIFNFISENPEMLFGNVLEIFGKPCAYDLIIKSASPRWISFDIPNGGVDPKFNKLSVGSVLMWVNTQQAISLCKNERKKIHFSLGSPTMPYKIRWSTPNYLFRTL